MKVKLIWVFAILLMFSMVAYLNGAGELLAVDVTPWSVQK